MKKIEVQEFIALVKNGKYSEEELQEIKAAIGSHLSYLIFCKNQGIEPYVKLDDEGNINGKVIMEIKEGEEIEKKRIEDFAKKLEINYRINDNEYIFYKEVEKKSLMDIPPLRFLLCELKRSKELYKRIEYYNLRTGEKEVVK